MNGSPLGTGGGGDEEDAFISSPASEGERTPSPPARTKSARSESRDPSDSSSRSPSPSRDKGKEWEERAAAKKSSPATFLILGPSGVGKTVAAKKIIARSPQRYLILCNANMEDYRSTGKKISFSELEDLSRQFRARNISYLLEDIHLVPDKQLPLIRQLLNFVSRHLSSLVVMVCHTISRNNVFSLLYFFTNIVIPYSRVGRIMLSKLCVHFQVTKPEKVLERFDELKSFQYLCLQPQEGGFLTLDRNLRLMSRYSYIEGEGEKGSKSGGETVPSPRVDAVLRRLCNKTAQAIFLFVFPTLKKLNFDPADLSVRYKGRGRLSVIDYVEAMRDPTVVPPKPIRRLHSWLARRLVFPSSLCSNGHLKPEREGRGKKLSLEKKKRKSKRKKK